MKEICANCGKPKSEHHGRRMTVHPYGWELACTVNGIDHFTPRETVSVPKDFVEAARNLVTKIEGFKGRYEIYCSDFYPETGAVRIMLDQID